MSRNHHRIRLGTTALAFGVCLTLAGCGGSSHATGAGGPGGGITAGGGGGAGAASDPECAAVAQAYKAFQTAVASKPTGQQADDFTQLNTALGNVLGPNASGSDRNLEIVGLETDASTMADDIREENTYGGYTVPSPGVTTQASEDLDQFNTDLQAISQDCGIALSPYKPR